MSRYLSVIFATCFAVGLFVPSATAAPLTDAQVREACEKLYIHGVTAEIAADEVGIGGIPALLRLLKDPSFTRRDNVVAFLWHLGGRESTDALVQTLESPAGDASVPEEDRALMLVPGALGQIAARGDRRALRALLEMTDPAGDGGAIGRAQIRGTDPERYRQDLRERAYRGLALSKSDKGRARLTALLRAAGGDARQAREVGSSLALMNEAAGSGSTATPPPPSASTHSGRAADTQTRTQDSPMTYANHAELEQPMSDALLDSVLHGASWGLGTANFPGDVACCVTMTRSGSGGTFGTPGDGLANIDDAVELEAVLSSGGVRGHIVRYINFCGGGLTPNVLGCAYQPGFGMAFSRGLGGAAHWSVWAHEYGHNIGLGHVGSSNSIMYTYANTGGGLSQSECDTYHAPFGGGATDIGSCADTDADDLHDLIDNCPLVANTSQPDVDHDGVGDSCDTLCGNAVVDGNDECDDGNADPRDGCTNSCTICGDGIQTIPEQCDDGNNDTNDGCTNACTVCGDLYASSVEQCDDGNLLWGDGCAPDCRPSYCGSGATPPLCDDYNVNPFDGCTLCVPCGDGVIDADEECDDGNLVGGDGCTAACSVCGNSVVSRIETCDDGNLVSGDGCSPQCQNEGCGNGWLDPGEECDDGNYYQYDGCPSTTCQICGNGNVTAPETCDDGNLVDGDGCSSHCDYCGDGTRIFPEECDDGNSNPYDGCTNNCTLCPNGNVMPPEQCDGGYPYSGCTLACTFCGDSIITPPEECDDGDGYSGDGCSANCTVENGGGVCGNGTREFSEQCDDGNVINGDGCSSLCRWESSGHYCGNPATVPPTGGTVTGILGGSSTMTGSCGGPGPEQVFAWTPSQSGVAYVATCGSTIDTVVYLRSTDCNTGTQIGCIDDGCGYQSSLEPIVQAGTTYFIVVDNFNLNGGPFTLTVELPSVCGDGLTSHLEECDDGNLVPDDGCTAACTLCGNGVTTAPETCDDGNIVANDGCSSSCVLGCPAVPLAGCRLPTKPGKASIQLKNATDDVKDQLQWKWGSGAVTAKADFGAPTADDPYVLCVWDAAGPVLTTTAPPSGLCGTKPCWVEKATSFAYKNKSLFPRGLEKLDLKEGLVAGKAKIGAKGKGALLTMPTLAGLSAPVQVQLIRPGGPCWGSTFSAPFGKQDAGQLKDKSD